jgi:hypothetical protein
MQTWTECKLPGVPGEAANMIAVSVPDLKGRTRDVCFDPAGRFDINEYLQGTGGVDIGTVQKSTDGATIVFINGAGRFDLGYGRMTRKGMALRIAARLAGLTIIRDNAQRARVAARVTIPWYSATTAGQLWRT